MRLRRPQDPINTPPRDQPLDLRPGLCAVGDGPAQTGALTGTRPANPGLLRTVENPAGSYFFPTEVQGQEQNLFKITYGTQSQFQVKNNSSDHHSGRGNTGCGADPEGPPGRRSEAVVQTGRPRPRADGGRGVGVGGLSGIWIKVSFPSLLSPPKHPGI